jgi:transposase
MRSIGVDLHKDMFYVCFLEGEEDSYKKYALKELGLFKKELLKSDQVAVEATGNTRYFVDQIKSDVLSVKIVNPSQFRVISDSVKKTDKEDSKLLALFLSKELLPEVRLKDSNYSQIKSISNTRDRLVKLRTALKNKIHNILNAHGIVSTKADFNSKKGLGRALSHDLNSSAQIELKVIVDQILSLNNGIKELDAEMLDKGKKLKGYDNLTSIKGIGEKGATILLSTIGNIDDFDSEKKLSAYFGIIPRVESSNTTTKMGRITKRGSKLGRSTLVQCTLIVIRYSKYFRQFYDRLKAKKGSGKAIIATARKLLGLIYNTLKNDWVFKDFPNFILAN